MNFRTQVELPKRETEIRHSDRIMLFGSCFAENIGNLLLANKFRCDVNPFGILYNPLSIVEALWQFYPIKHIRRRICSMPEAVGTVGCIIAFFSLYGSILFVFYKYAAGTGFSRTSSA